MALTEEQKENIKNRRPMGTGVSPKEYAKRKSGKSPVPLSDYAKKRQAMQPGPVEIGMKVASELPQTKLAMQAGGLAVEAAKAPFEAVGEQVASGERRRKTVSKFGLGSTKELESGVMVDQPQRLPTGSMSTIPTPMGSESLPAYKGVEPTRVGAVGERQDDTDDSPYEITDSTLTPEQTEDFQRQPTAPGTRMRSGPGFGNRPEGGWHPDYDKGDSGEKEIRPPSSIGDIMRYNREVAERDKGIKAADTSARTETIARETAARTDISRDKAELEKTVETAKMDSSAKRQERLDKLMTEYDDPETTPERRSMIERQQAMLSGRTLPRKEDTRVKGVVMKVPDPDNPLSEGKEILVNPYTRQEINPDTAAAGGQKSPVSVKTKAEHDLLESGASYIAEDGKTYVKK